jgi:hypothetical protein
MFHLGELAQKSSEGRAGIARGSIGFFARGGPPFFGSFFGQAKKNKKAKIIIDNTKFGLRWILQSILPKHLLS